MNNEFLNGLGIGSIIGVLFQIFFRHWLQKREENKKSICKKCDDVADVCQKLIKSATLLYCSDYNREKAIELKADFKNFASIIQELNNDLGFLNKNYEIKSTEIISFRQAVTGELFSLRGFRYNYSDPLINSIHMAGDVVFEKLRSFSRALR